MRKTRICVFAIISVLILSACFSDAATRRTSRPAQTQTQSRTEGTMTPEQEEALIQAAHAMRKSGVIHFNFRDMDLVRFIRFMSEILNTNIIMPSIPNRKITIISPNPVTIQEARDMMISALNVHELYVKDNGKYLTIYGPQAYKASGYPVPAQTTKNNPAIISRDSSVSLRVSSDSEISAEVIESFIRNPFDEFKRIRLRPSDTAGGFEVIWLQNDSILKRLGVQRGDVIRAVNGIKFDTLNSLGEIIQSIIKLERFDLEVMCSGVKGEIINLNHAVKKEPEINSDDKQ